jgi:hypothetical protein
MKRVRGWLILGAVVVLLFVFMKPIERYSDALIHAPWAYGWDSRGDLTDDWTAVLPDGRSLDLTLARETGPDGLPTPADDSDARLVGTGKLCSVGGETAVFSLAGSSNRRGSQIRLKLFQAETVVGQLDGRWSGETLALSGNLLAESLELVLNRGLTC